MDQNILISWIVQPIIGMTVSAMRIKKRGSWPWLGRSAVWSTAYIPQGCRFDPQSGLIHRLQIWSLVWAQTGGNRSMFLSDITAAKPCCFPRPLAPHSKQVLLSFPRHMSQHTPKVETVQYTEMEVLQIQKPQHLPNSWSTAGGVQCYSSVWE